MSNSEACSAQSSHTLTISPSTSLNQSLSQTHSIQETNGQAAFTKLETKLSADHAGLSVLQSHSQTDSALPQVVRSTLFSQPKIWFHATRATSLAMVVTSTKLGNTLRPMVLFQTNANHTNQAKAASHLAQLNVLMAQPSRNTNASKAQQPKPEAQLLPSNSSNHQVQLRLASLSMLTSSTTKVVSITTSQVVLKVATPSRSLVGVNKVVKTTGLLPTLGVPHGVRVDSSESEKVTQALTQLPSVALQTSTHLLVNSSNEQPTSFERCQNLPIISNAISQHNPKAEIYF